MLALAVCTFAHAGEADAVAIAANIRARHMPFGTLLDPIYASPTSDRITGYTRCGDSALWTGAFLAAESFRYNVTKSSDALANVRAALAGLKRLADVTGDNRLARCIVVADSPFAAGIASEEAHNTVHQAAPYIWLDNTSRDQVVGAFFGLGVAFDFVDDNDVRAGVSDVATRLIGFVSRHQWSPNDDIGNTFVVRPEELQMLLQVARRVNPSISVNGPLFVPPVNVGVDVDVQSRSSYFKFNLDFLTFFNLLRLQDTSDNLNAYKRVREYTASHQNAFFNMIDRALQGPAAARDTEVRALLDAWLERPRRDTPVDLTRTVQVCGDSACQPVPVAQRPPTDFIWQRDPFQLAGGGSGLIETAGIDYILPYWMARYYGVIGGAVQSAAAVSSAVAPGSLASIYGNGLATTTAQASSLPLPTSLGGASVTVTDSAGTARPAALVYTSPTQFNFVVPGGTATGIATISTTSSAMTQFFTVPINQVAPTLFATNGAGTGLAAATAVRIAANNVQTPVPVFQCTNGGCTAVPIAIPDATQVFVSFYGTGIRNRTSLANVTVTIKGASVPVQYVGPSPEFTGLDQVNVQLPQTLRGSGDSPVILTADGKVSNVVSITVQ